MPEHRGPAGPAQHVRRGADSFDCAGCVPRVGSSAQTAAHLGCPQLSAGLLEVLEAQVEVGCRSRGVCKRRKASQSLSRCVFPLPTVRLIVQPPVTAVIRRQACQRVEIGGKAVGVS